MVSSLLLIASLEAKKASRDRCKHLIRGFLVAIQAIGVEGEKMLDAIVFCRLDFNDF